MRKGLRFALILTLAAALAAGASRVPEALAEVEAFRVRDYTLEGARFLSLDELVRTADVPPDASVWDDPGAWEERLRGHPLIRDVRIERDLPATLVLRVEEVEPVALVPTPTLEPVDASGRILPLDPAAFRLDLPLIRPRWYGTGGRALTPDEVRSLARELGRLRSVDPGFAARISEVALAGRGHVVVELAEPRVRVRFEAPLTTRRLREGLQALSDAMGRIGPDAPRSVDLRFEDQVVVHVASGKGS